MLTNKFATRAVLTGLSLLLMLMPTTGEAGLFGRKGKAAQNTVGADLAVIDLRVHEVRTGGTEPRLVLQALVENQKPVNRTEPFEVIIRRQDAKHALGTCRGEALPQGQVALCELWLAGEPVKQGDVFEAVLNRSIGNFAKWDTDPSDDRRTYEIRTIAERGQALRLVRFDLDPLTIQGSSEVQFRFQVEGAHLVWLLAGDEPPRLLAGHPADGLLQGKGKQRLSKSGPVTLVARNSFGSYIYQTVPVRNVYDQDTTLWSKVTPQQADDVPVMKVLDPGVYDVDEDVVILENLRQYLASKDWALAVRERDERARPRETNVLNPKAREEKQPD